MSAELQLLMCDDFCQPNSYEQMENRQTEIII